MVDASLTLKDLVISRLGPGYDPGAYSALTEAMLQDLHLDGYTLKRVASTLPRQVVAGAIGVNGSDLGKLCQRKRLSRIQSEQISDLTNLWAELNHVFLYDEQVLSEWLESKLPVLNGRSPFQLMQTLAGRKALRVVLLHLEHGDFS